MNASVSEHIDRILIEQPIGMSEAARLMGTFRSGRGCHPSTLVRWCLSGIRLSDGSQLRLEHIRCANRLMTSRPALLRFLGAQQSPDDSTQIQPPRSPADRRHAITAAEKELAAMGIG